MVLNKKERKALEDILVLAKDKKINIMMEDTIKWLEEKMKCIKITAKDILAGKKKIRSWSTEPPKE